MASLGRSAKPAILRCCNSGKSIQMDKVAFYGGVLVVVIGLLVWIIRPNQAVGKSEIALFGMKFVFDTPAFAVMIIGIALMLLSPRLPPYLVSATPEPIKKVVCIGQNENNCP